MYFIFDLRSGFSPSSKGRGGEEKHQGQKNRPPPPSLANPQPGDKKMVPEMRRGCRWDKKTIEQSTNQPMAPRSAVFPEGEGHKQGLGKG